MTYGTVAGGLNYANNGNVTLASRCFAASEFDTDLLIVSHSMGRWAGVFMMDFITRIELHLAEQNDYAKLAKAMADMGFSEKAPPDAEPPLERPTPEYHFQGALTRADVLDLASQAAATVQDNYTVRVTNSMGLTWQVNLPAR